MVAESPTTVSCCSAQQCWVYLIGIWIGPQDQPTDSQHSPSIRSPLQPVPSNQLPASLSL